MTVRVAPAASGARRSRQLRSRIADELVNARIAAGLSQREVARRVGVGPMRVARAEAADPSAMTIDLVARIAVVLGLQLATSLYPDGDPVRDRGQLALMGRFRPRLARSLRWREEVVVPIAGDRRSGDGLIGGDGWSVLVEAETRLGDVQLVERRAAAKQRDLGADALILLVAATKHNREVICLHPELLERFPVHTRTALRRLGAGEHPGGDALVIL